MTTLATVERLWLHQNLKVLLVEQSPKAALSTTRKGTALKEAIVQLFPMPVICVTDSLPLAIPSLIRLKETDGILLHASMSMTSVMAWF